MPISDRSIASFRTAAMHFSKAYELIKWIKLEYKYEFVLQTPKL